MIFQASLDGIGISSGISPIVLTGLSEGPHALVLYGVDLSGNLSVAPVVHNFTVDVTAPVVNTDASSGAPLTRETTNSVSFSASELGSATCDLNGAGFSPCTSPVTYSGLADGNQVLTIQFTDLSGNIAPPAIVTWTVDTTAPRTTLAATLPALDPHHSHFNPISRRDLYLFAQ